MFVPNIRVEAKWEGGEEVLVGRDPLKLDGDESRLELVDGLGWNLPSSVMDVPFKSIWISEIFQLHQKLLHVLIYSRIVKSQIPILADDVYSRDGEGEN